ncbi:MAG: hypothetical protein U9R41_07930 [Candidatus Marinimicrobia bacterium]|nr:hypothetical protein [Candidatus Neomarinimicrobiota bacterium]
MNFKKVIIVLFVLIVNVQFGIACTSAVISGKATIDGRPILWKHRDTGTLENKLIYIEGEKYDLVGIANSSDTTGKNIWMGSNKTGFSIMNTASYNVNTDTTCDIQDDQEGTFMRKALEICSDLSDFENLLRETSGKRGVAANFGVIDANGGAAYYETGYYSYKKYDANLSKDGYLIRTNFSISGDDKNGLGIIRYKTTSKLFKNEYEKNKLSVNFILKKATRNLKHSLTGKNIMEMKLPENKFDTTFVCLSDYVVRSSTASSMVIQGVKKNENPELTTMWTILGWPLLTVVTPVWVAEGDDLPKNLTSVNNKNSFINQNVLELKSNCFPIKLGNGYKYLNLSVLMNKENNGYIQTILPKEKKIIDIANKLLKKWREKGINKKELKNFYKWLDEYINEIYRF